MAKPEMKHDRMEVAIEKLQVSKDTAGRIRILLGILPESHLRLLFLEMIERIVEDQEKSKSE